MQILDLLKAKIRGTINLAQLKKDGLLVGNNFNVQEGVIIDPGHCWLIEIGDNVTLAPRVHILAHDASMKKSLGYTKIGKVIIGDNVFIGAGSIVLPGVKIGNNSVIGAGSVVTHSLQGNGIYVGNPVKRIKDYDEWLHEQKHLMAVSPCYDESFKITAITEEKKGIMKKQLVNKKGFIV